MSIELLFQTTACDGGLCAWIDTKKVVVSVPDELKDYHLIGGIMPANMPDVPSETICGDYMC